ncbi:MAG: hypothetical protein JXB88_06560 [Spirochaetales bacterium]|nr:hypothetical protein [Spirochaetales bacterium]
MITPGEIKEKAKKSYYKFLKAWLKEEEFFPLDIPSNKGKSTDPYLVRKQELEVLIEQSRLKKEFGYSLELKEVNTRKEGLQTIVNRLFFAHRSDFLGYIEKEAEFRRFKESVGSIGTAIPALKPWIYHHIALVINNYYVWKDLILVCNYFINNPRPGCYVRELPVPVHTKFIEENQGILRKLLDYLLPAESIKKNETDFALRFFLKKPEPMIRFRILDKETVFMGLKDVAVLRSDFDMLKIPAKKVVIMENLITFLTFPSFKDTIAMVGLGFGVSGWKDVRWLNDKEIIYWGDIDPPGFEILSSLRSVFPHTRSVMMDRKTYNTFRPYTTRSLGMRKCLSLNLTPSEYEMYEYLLINPKQSRLEQERISLEYCKEIMTPLLT